MKRILIALLATLLLLPASRPWAQPDLELYSAEVCNKGQITVDVGVAYKDFGFSEEFWVIDGWYDVPKGTCKTVFAHSYVKQDRNWLGFRSFPVHLAFAFTDSTGVWGNPPGQPLARHCPFPFATVRHEEELRVQGGCERPGGGM